MGRDLAVLHFKASSAFGAGDGTKALSSLVAEDKSPPPRRGIVGDLPARPPQMACGSLARALGLGLASEDKSEPSVW